MVSPLVARLTAIQDEQGLTDVVFASLLGVNRATWCLTRLGIRTPSLALIEGALRRWPDLAPTYAQSLQETIL